MNTSSKKSASQNRQTSGTINSLLNDMSNTVTGFDNVTEIDELDQRFSQILNDGMDVLVKPTTGSDGTTTSFIQSLYKNNSMKNANYNQFSNNNSNSIFDDNITNAQSVFSEVYRNKFIKHKDLHEIASALIELREAILVTRDAITSSDIVDGHMSRTLKFTNCPEEVSKNAIAIVEDLEAKFKLQDKIKNFIVPKSLEYGSYYVYRVPYSEIFKDFMDAKNAGEVSIQYTESTVLESVSTTEKLTYHPRSNKDTTSKHNTEFSEQVLSVLKESAEYSEIKSLSSADIKVTESKIESGIKDGIDELLSHVTISNTPTPLMVLEHGPEAVYEYVQESTRSMAQNNFTKITGLKTSEGVYTTKEKSNEFKTVNDCYVKMLNPLNVIPVKLVNKKIGYYYIQDGDLSSSGKMQTSFKMVLSSDSMNNTVIDMVAAKIVQSFDRKFLEANQNFKETIVEALQYYNVKDRKIKLQFIPAEHISEFKINEDENGDGVSIIDGSLFYAKLYLMLLLFKLISIVRNSNDTKINYIRSSGIDKDIRGKIEEIARKKQEQTINMMDLFNYTNIMKKMSIGAEMYLPTGRGNERGIETEILSGQEVQLNTELMDSLRNQYILATGVPAAIMNYLNEADFAKSLELANTKWNGRIVSNQLDFNDGITDFYKYLMHHCTDLPSETIDSFEFSFSPPKSANNQVKQELLTNFTAYADWALGMFLGENSINDPDNVEAIRDFKFKLAEDALPMINMQHIKELFEDSQANAIKAKLVPKPDISDDGMDEDIPNA